MTTIAKRADDVVTRNVDKDGLTIIKSITVTPSYGVKGETRRFVAVIPLKTFVSISMFSLPPSLSNALHDTLRTRLEVNTKMTLTMTTPMNASSMTTTI